MTSPYALTWIIHTCFFQVFACWTMLGDGSRLVVGYVGMFRTVQSGQKKCVTPPFSNLIPMLPVEQITDTYTHLMNRYGS